MISVEKKLDRQCGWKTLLVGCFMRKLVCIFLSQICVNGIVSQINNGRHGYGNYKFVDIVSGANGEELLHGPRGGALGRLKAWANVKSDAEHYETINKLAYKGAAG